MGTAGRILLTLTMLVGCKPSAESAAPTASSATSAPTPSASTVATPSATASVGVPLVDAALDVSRCEVKGAFVLADVLSDPSCTLSNTDPRVKDAMDGKKPAGALDVELVTANTKAKAGALLDLEIKVTNRGTVALALVVLVRPDEWFAVDAWAKGADAPERLVVKRGSSFPPSETRPAWWAQITIAPGAVGSTHAAVLASARRVEHRQGAPGIPAPYVNVVEPLAAGTYTFGVTEPLLGTTSKNRGTLTVVP